jgi:hypothetical protein
MTHRLKRLAAGVAAVLAIAVGSAVVANAASNGGATGNQVQQQPSTTDVRPVQQSGPDPGTDRGPGRPPCHHRGGSGGNGSGDSGSSSGSSGSSGQI